MKLRLLPLLLAIASLAAPKTFSADATKPLKVLLITGGCCHDYTKQKDILKAGIEKRANIEVVQLHSADSGTKVRYTELESPTWAQGYDAIIHDECSADVKDVPYVENILAAHKAGVPGVNLHCAMHSYRTGTPIWFEYLGLQSSGHGPQLPIQINFVKKDHPITTGLEDWTTVKEELYNNLKVWEGAAPLARGKQGAGDKPGENDALLAWTNEYGPKKTRIFSTTLAHNNETVGDDRYLELVTRGILWSCGKLRDDGKPAAGYGK
jgi:type 1 glutamine amidotransferase